MIRKIILVLCLVLIQGCSTNYLKSLKSENWNSNVSPEVMRAWREHQSYYALIEILDTHIMTPSHSATKEEVLKYLGPGEDDPEEGHPNSGPNVWIYPSNRKIPYGSYCMIFFDEEGKVSGIGWCDE